MGRRRRSVSPRFNTATLSGVDFAAAGSTITYVDDIDNFTFEEERNGVEEKTDDDDDDDDAGDGNNGGEMDSNGAGGSRTKRGAGGGGSSGSDSSAREIKYDVLKFPHREDGIGGAGGNGGGGGGGAGGGGGGKKGRKDSNRMSDSKQKDPPCKFGVLRYFGDFCLNNFVFLVFDVLVKDIRLKVKDSKKFWSNLPFQVCNGEDFAVPVSGKETSCWNGVSIDK